MDSSGTAKSAVGRLDGWGSDQASPQRREEEPSSRWPGWDESLLEFFEAGLNPRDRTPESENAQEVGLPGHFMVNLAVTYFPGQLLVKYLRRRRA